MQLSKVLLVIGATSVCLTPLAGHTADKASVAPLIAPPPSSPDAVEKARAAMRQKMDELPATAPAAAPQAPAPAAPALEAPAPTPAPAPAAQTAVPAADPGAIDKAREALRQKMAELQPPAPVAAQPAPAKEAQAPAQAPQAPAYAAEPAAPFRPVIPVADSAALEKAREALHQKMTELNGQPEKAKAAALTVTPVAAKHAPGFAPLSAPPSPLSAAKQERLNDLLVKYKADQVTPEQYHAERAKILAEP